MTNSRDRSNPFPLLNVRGTTQKDEGAGELADDVRFFEIIKTFPPHRRAKLIAIREELLSGTYETPEKWAVALRQIRRTLSATPFID